MTDSPRWCQECHGYGDHHTDKHVFVSGVEEDRERLFEIMRRAINSEGRLTTGDSADLDYAHDMLDEFFDDLAKRTIAAELTRQIDMITAELICCHAYDDAEPMRRMIQEAHGSEKFKIAGTLYSREHDLCYWAGAITHEMSERVKSLMGDQ